MPTIAPAWRWVFYVNVPIGICGLAIAWAASAGWDTPRQPARLDLSGAALFTVALAAILAGTTLIGNADQVFGVPTEVAVGGLITVGVAFGLAAIWHGLHRPLPFLDPRLFADRVFSSAALISMLTGYGMATAIVGGAVFVDRVPVRGPGRATGGAGGDSRGDGARCAGLGLPGASGVAASFDRGRAAAERRRPGVDVDLGPGGVDERIRGLGGGLRDRFRAYGHAAIHGSRGGRGRAAFGAASATVTVARMIGMAVGMAALTAYGSTTITRISNEIYGSGDTYKQYIPAYLRDRSINDGLVVQALEQWAATKGATILVGIFLVAAVVTLIALVPALMLRARPRIDRPDASGHTEETQRGEIAF